MNIHDEVVINAFVLRSFSSVFTIVHNAGAK